MPGTSKSRNPRGYTIDFDEATHSYTSIIPDHITSTGAVVVGSDGNGPYLPDTDDAQILVRYTSVTSFVNHFFPKFDAEGIAKRVAAKRGTSPQAILAEWEANKNYACSFGTRVHETCEDVFHRRLNQDGTWSFRNKPADDRERKVFSSAFRAASEVLEKYTLLGVEQVVFDVDCRLAGTVDWLAKSSDGTIVIGDHKTNQHLDETCKYGTKALDPISHLDDCNLVHYQLQLSTYELLLRKAGYIPRDAKVRRVIDHLTENGHVWHELPDRSIEVRDMLIAMLEQPPF